MHFFYGQPHQHVTIEQMSDRCRFPRLGRACIVPTYVCMMVMWYHTTSYFMATPSFFFFCITDLFFLHVFQGSDGGHRTRVHVHELFHHTRRDPGASLGAGPDHGKPAHVRVRGRHGGRSRRGDFLSLFPFPCSRRSLCGSTSVSFPGRKITLVHGCTFFFMSRLRFAEA